MKYYCDRFKVINNKFIKCNVYCGKTNVKFVAFTSMWSFFLETYSCVCESCYDKIINNYTLTEYKIISEKQYIRFKRTRILK